MRNTITLFIIGLMIAGIVGCEAAPETSDKDVEPIAYKQLRTMIDEASEDDPLVIIDVRSLAKYELDHIPGAINIFLPDLRSVSSNDPRLTNANKIVVYADGFGDSLSPIAAKDLLARGFSNVYDFRGGLDKWNKEAANPPGEHGKE